MAAKHARAVQNYSELTNYRTLYIFTVIATDVGAEGQPAYTSLKTLAERSRCSIKTVKKYIDEIVATGELIRTREGKRTYYALNENVIPINDAKNECEIIEDEPCAPPPKRATATNDNELSEIKSILKMMAKQQESMWNVVSSTLVGHRDDESKTTDNIDTTIGKTPGIQGANQTTSANKDRSIEDKRKKEYKRESDTPSHYQNFELITNGIPAKLKYLKPHIDAILKVTRKNKHNQRIIEFASIYHEGEIPPQAILDYFIGDNSKWNTESFGKDGQVPYVGHLESEYGNLWAWYKQGCPAPKVKQAHANGHSPVLNVEFDSGGGW